MHGQNHIKSIGLIIYEYVCSAQTATYVLPAVCLDCHIRTHFFYIPTHEGKGKAYPVHAMKAYRRTGGVTPFILKLGI